jgi:hypothetical protein
MTTQVLTHDASKYHPHDLLILKHFPEQDLPALWDVDDTYSLVYDTAWPLEEADLPPPHIPWPLPPLRPHASLKPGVEAWRRAIL